MVVSTRITKLREIPNEGIKYKETVKQQNILLYRRRCYSERQSSENRTVGCKGTDRCVVHIYFILLSGDKSFLIIILSLVDFHLNGLHEGKGFGSTRLVKYEKSS